MADMAPRSEGFCTETLLIQLRLGDPESLEEVCKPLSLGVGVARVGRCPAQELSSEPASHEPQSARRRCVFLFFCSALQNRTTDVVVQNSSLADRKLIPNQSVLALTDRTGGLQNCMSLTPKTKRDPESGSWDSNNSFILNNMAERVGFEPRLSNKISNLGGANGTSNLHKSTRTMNSTFYWTLNGR